MASAAHTVDVTFHGDLGCPWTWVASRWLVSVAERRSLTVGWRSFPLALADDDHASQHTFQQTLRAMRILEAVAARGEHGRAGAFFMAYGTRLHLDRRRAGDELALDAANEAGIPDGAELLHDDTLDELVQQARNEACADVGSGVGSPLLRFADQRGLFGPVLTELPVSDDALALWDAVCLLRTVPAFSELKRGRGDDPDLDSTRTSVS